VRIPPAQDDDQVKATGLERILKALQLTASTRSKAPIRPNSPRRKGLRIEPPISTENRYTATPYHA
jgi:hypothetical protein